MSLPVSCSDGNIGASRAGGSIRKSRILECDIERATTGAYLRRRPRFLFNQSTRLSFVFFPVQRFSSSVEANLADEP